MNKLQEAYFREVIAMLALMRKCSCASCDVAKRAHLERCWDLTR